MTERELEEREKALLEREKTIAERESKLNCDKADPLENKPFSKAVQEKKEDWFDKVPFTVHQLDIIIGCGIAALVIVFVLIGLEAAGIFKL